MEVDGAVEVVAAACVIHNICEMRKEPYFVEWLQEGFEQPEEEVIQDGPIDEQPRSEVRDTLAAFFIVLIMVFWFIYNNKSNQFQKHT